MALFSKAKLKKLSQEHQEPPTPKKHTLLLVDDEEPNLLALVDILKEDYTILTAKDGQEALELVQKDPTPTRIHLIISDQRMPKMSGIEFLKHTRSIIPKTIRIILTGFTDINAIIDSINEGNIYKFITKPYEPKELKVTIQRALESFELEQKNQKLMKVFEKFVPNQFLNRVAPEGLENFQSGRAKMEHLSILFSNIRAFVQLSENMTPQEVLDFLNSYYQRINQPIHQHHGFIDKFIGNGIMALFDRTDSGNKINAQDSVHAAIGMQQAINEFNEKRLKNSESPIMIGVGVHTGETVVGTIGSKDRFDSTALGDCINQAARLVSISKSYESKIIISESTYRLLDKDQFHIRKIDTPRVKGKVQPVTIYEVYDADLPEVFEKKKQSHKLLEQAIEHFNSSQLSSALDSFNACLKIYPEDTVPRQYLERIRHIEKYFRSKKSNLILKQFHNNLQDLMKRELERFDCSTPIQLSLMTDNAIYEGQLVNISQSGMQFKSDELFDLDTTILGKINFAKTPYALEMPLKLLGRVIRRNNIKTNEVNLVKYYGVEFVHCSENDFNTLRKVLSQLALTY